MTKIAQLLRGIEPSSFFLVVAVIFGGLFLFVTPPLQGPDEQAHFVQAYKVSEGKIGAPVSSANSDVLPTSLSETYKLLFYGQNDIRFDGNRKYSLGETKQALNIPLNQQEKSKSGYLSGTAYSAVAYAPQAFLITVGRLFNLPPIMLIYLGRIGGLIAWIAIIYLALRIIPVAKWAAVVIALLPMSLFQASVISADTIPLALLSLYIALILRFSLSSQKEISSRGILILTSVAVLMSLGKQIMVIFTPLVLLLTLRGHKDNRPKATRLMEFMKVSLVILIPLLIAVGWTLVAGGSQGDVSQLEKQNANPTLQIRHLIVHPTEFLFALWNTNFYNWGDGVTRALIGTFGWADTPMALNFTIAGFFMLIIVLLANRGEDYRAMPWVTRKLSRGLLLVLMLGFFLATSLAMYIYYSPVDFNIIVGLQGRYFLPILPLLLLVMINNDQVTLKPATYVFFSRIMPVLMLSVSSMYVVIRYYLPTLI